MRKVAYNISRSVKFLTLKERFLKSHFKIFLTILLFTISTSLYAETDVNLIRLDGKWELFLKKTPEQTFNLVDKKQAADFMCEVPGDWNKEVITSGETAPETYGCYRYVYSNLQPEKEYALFMNESPGTSSAIYINRNQIAKSGNPFPLASPDFSEKLNSYTKSNSISKPLFCSFYPDKNGNAEIIIFVSNYFYRKGGLWDTVFFGTSKRISQFNTVSLVLYSIIIGSLLFISLLNIVQFLFNHKRIEYLYLGLASLVFALRVGTAGYSTFSVLFPRMPSEVKIKLEYFALWLAPISILQMLFSIYPSKTRVIGFKFIKEKALRYSIITIVTILGILSLVLPGYYSNRLVPVMQVGMGIISLYVVIFSISNLIKRKKYSLYIFLSYFTLCIGALVDTAYTKIKSLMPISLFPFFIVIFVVIQIIMLAAIQNDVYKTTTKASNDLKRLNEAYLRFVPKEFLQLLNKDSITKTKLGDYSNIEMSIIFSKVNIECKKSESSLEEHFVIFNEYLKLVSPIIKKYDGFVSKFLSGGFMALFPNSELDAIRTALEINDCVKRFNESDICKNYDINPYIAVHYGKMIIGTIGEEGRLDDTVISDTVNTAARIETVCERLKKNIIISQSLEKLMSQNNTLQYEIKELEAMYVKGKEKPLQLYELSRKNKKTTGEES